MASEPDPDVLISYERDNVPQHLVIGGRAVGQQVPQGLQTLACEADGILGIPACRAAPQSTSGLGLASLQQAPHLQGGYFCSFAVQRPAQLALCPASIVQPCSFFKGPVTLAEGPAGAVPATQQLDTQLSGLGGRRMSCRLTILRHTPCHPDLLPAAQLAPPCSTPSKTWSKLDDRLQPAW